VFHQNRENPEKLLVESAFAIFDTSYLRYAAAENSKCFSGLLPGPVVQHWGRSSLAFAVREEIHEGQHSCGSRLAQSEGENFIEIPAGSPYNQQ
jgi:hypothetical protein